MQGWTCGLFGYFGSVHSVLEYFEFQKRRIEILTRKIETGSEWTEYSGSVYSVHRIDRMM